MIHVKKRNDEVEWGTIEDDSTDYSELYAKAQTKLAKMTEEERELYMIEVELDREQLLKELREDTESR